MAVSHSPQATTTCLSHLSELERDAWFGFLRVHAALTKRLDADLVARCGLPLSAFEVLARVAGADEGHLRISELAHSALLSQSRVSRIVDALEADGYLERRTCATDSRVVHATITERGRELAEAASARHAAEVQSRFFAQLSDDEVRELASVWRRVLGSS